MISVYKIKPAFQKVLQPVLRGLHKIGVTANQLTIVAIILSCAMGYGFLQYQTYHVALLIIPIGLLLRMALNALDGMMARQYNMQSQLGEVLNELGVIKKNSEGYWEQIEKNTKTGSKYSSLVVRSYQAKSLEMAQESLNLHGPELRDISVSNLAIDANALSDISEILKECRKQIQQRVEAVNSPDRVMRMALSVFPVAICEDK